MKRSPSQSPYCKRLSLLSPMPLRPCVSRGAFGAWPTFYRHRSERRTFVSLGCLTASKRLLEVSRDHHL